MAQLSPLEEKLGEVLGLAQAAQGATEDFHGKDEVAADALARMRDQAMETERRCAELLAARRGKRAAILAKARETRREAIEMMRLAYGTAPISAAPSRAGAGG
jgi:hypothetical protein